MWLAGPEGGRPPGPALVSAGDAVTFCAEEHDVGIGEVFAAPLHGLLALRGGSFARALPGGSPTGAAAAAHSFPGTSRSRSPP